MTVTKFLVPFVIILGVILALRFTGVFEQSVPPPASPAPVPPPTSPEASSATGIISEAVMAMSVDENHRPVEPTSVFPTHAEGFFCTFKVTDAPPDTVITAEWIYVGGEVEEDVGPKFVISKASHRLEGTVYTSFYNFPPFADYEWPRGDYKVVLCVDSEEEVSVPFSVR